MAEQNKVKQATGPSEEEDSDPNYDLFIVALTIISLFTMVVLLLPVYVSAPAKTIALLLDLVVSAIFMFDFFRSLQRAPDRRAYLRWGWMDFLGSLPALPFLRVFRIWRVLRAVRILRRRSLRELWNASKEHRAEGSLYIVVVVGLVLFGFSSFMLLEFEPRSPQATIITPEDAMWYSFVTITTVGYGDRVPVTSMGRVIGIFLMTAGIGFYSVLTSFLASSFIRPGGDKRAKEMAQMKADLEEMKQLLQELSQKIPDQT